MLLRLLLAHSIAVTWISTENVLALLQVNTRCLFTSSNQHSGFVATVEPALLQPPRPLDRIAHLSTEALFQIVQAYGAATALDCCR